ncbi:hypothetical protein EDC01DRAFT_336183 [Geopyxis carbonaria]|nr:hypothetical protein EDC01DRAFT_336183 [Geopyxis carbonaria]
MLFRLKEHSSRSCRFAILATKLLRLSWAMYFYLPTMTFYQEVFKILGHLQLSESCVGDSVVTGLRSQPRFVQPPIAHADFGNKRCISHPPEYAQCDAEVECHVGPQRTPHGAADSSQSWSVERIQTGVSIRAEVLFSKTQVCKVWYVGSCGEKRQYK